MRGDMVKTGPLEQDLSRCDIKLWEVISLFLCSSPFLTLCLGLYD